MRQLASKYHEMSREFEGCDDAKGQTKMRVLDLEITPMAWVGLHVLETITKPRSCSGKPNCAIGHLSYVLLHASIART